MLKLPVISCHYSCLSLTALKVFMGSTWILSVLPFRHSGPLILSWSYVWTSHCLFPSWNINYFPEQPWSYSLCPGLPFQVFLGQRFPALTWSHMGILQKKKITCWCLWFFSVAKVGEHCLNCSCQVHFFVFWGAGPTCFPLIIKISTFLFPSHCEKRQKNNFAWTQQIAYEDSWKKK